MGRPGTRAAGAGAGGEDGRRRSSGPGGGAARPPLIGRARADGLAELLTPRCTEPSWWERAVAGRCGAPASIRRRPARAAQRPGRLARDEVRDDRTAP